MKKSILFSLLIIALVGCKQHNRFSVSGVVKDAAGKMLYIEHTSLMNTTIIDSTKLGSDGEYKFKSQRPEYPDFYRLRLGDKMISFAVDSCEDIVINSQDKNFTSEYAVTGSETSAQIQKLRKSVVAIQAKADGLAEMSAETRIPKIEEIKKDIEAHKAMARQMILQNPKSMAAYFALYQMINNTYIFSPYVKEDKVYCKAVATSFNVFMPEYERSKNLYSLVMDAILTERDHKEKEAWDKILETNGIGYIDMALKDKKGITHKLSDLQGKVVLIDFSAYESADNVDYTFALRELYNKYHSRGFEIYQVSLDDNKILWEKSVENLPWVCVRDENGSNCRYVASYNVSSAPTTFLMDKKGNILARSLGYEQLSRAIADHL